MSKNPLITAAEEKVAQNTKQVAVQNYTQGDGDFFGKKWNMALSISNSLLIPSTFRGKVEDVMIAMELSEQMQMSLFTITQNLDIIQGKAGWKATFVIALINSSGRFNSNLKFQWDNNQNKSIENNNWGCTAYVELSDGSKLYGSRVSIEMAKKEGWTKKKNVEHTKWETMPEQMLQYRAAAFFSRIHCPDLLMGLQTSDEIIAVEPASLETKEKAKKVLPPKNIPVKEAVENKQKEISSIHTDENIVSPQAFKENIDEVFIEQDIVIESIKDLKSSLSLLGFKIMQIKENSKKEKWAQVVAADDEADFEQIMSVQGMKKINPNDSFFVMNVTNLE